MKKIVKIKFETNAKGWRSTKWDILRLLRSSDECFVHTEDKTGEAHLELLTDLFGQTVLVCGEAYTIAEKGKIIKVKDK